MKQKEGRETKKVRKEELKRDRKRVMAYYEYCERDTQYEKKKKKKRETETERDRNTYRQTNRQIQTHRGKHDAQVRQ